MVGASGSIHNQTCMLTNATVTASGTSMTMNVLVTFNETAVSLVYNIFGFAADLNGLKSAWTPIGTWTTAFVNQAPSFPQSALSPWKGAGLSQTFTATYQDINGVGNLNVATLEIASSITGAPACTVYYVNNWFALNAGGAGSGVTSWVQAGSTGSTSNGQCTLGNSVNGPSASNAVVTNSQGQLVGQVTLTMPITFTANDPSFTGLMYVWMFIQDANGLNSSYKYEGSWTVQ